MRKILFLPIVLVFVLSSSLVFAAGEEPSDLSKKAVESPSTVAESGDDVQNTSSSVGYDNVVPKRKPVIFSFSTGYSHAFPSQDLKLLDSAPGFSLNLTWRIPKALLFITADLDLNFYSKYGLDAGIYSTRLLLGLSHVFNYKKIGIEPFVGGGLVISAANIDTLYYGGGRYYVMSAPYFGAGGALTGGVRLFINRNFLFELSGKYDWANVSLTSPSSSSIDVDISGFTLFLGVGFAY